MRSSLELQAACARQDRVGCSDVDLPGRLRSLALASVTEDYVREVRQELNARRLTGFEGVGWPQAELPTWGIEPVSKSTAARARIAQ